MYKLVEDKFQASISTIPQPLFHRPPTLAPPSPSLHNSPLPIKPLTPTEMAARREKGLCFNCDAKFTLGHKCNLVQFLCLLVELEDLILPAEEPLSEMSSPPLEPIQEEAWIADTPSISLYTLTGQVVLSTLKIIDIINGKDIIVFIDGGSTNNFMQTKLANHLGLSVQPSYHFKGHSGE